MAAEWKRIPTSESVWLAIRTQHQEVLKPFATISEECHMMTEFGFDGCDFPIMGADTSWRYEGGEPIRIDEASRYWLCVGIEEQD